MIGLGVADQRLDGLAPLEQLLFVITELLMLQIPQKSIPLKTIHE